MNKVATGINGLDEMLNGGLPIGRSTLVLGGPGSGKTCFGLQFLLNGITQYNENGLFISLEQSAEHLREDAAGFCWDLAKIEKQRQLAIVDASPISNDPGESQLVALSIGLRDFSMTTLTEIIKSAAERTKAKRIVVDAIANLIVQYHTSFERRTALLDLLGSISKLGSTNIVTTENRATSLTRNVSPVEFLCDGVIVFHVYREGSQLVRALQIEKMRGMAHDEQIRPYRITNKGIVVYDKEESVEIPAETLTSYT